MSDYLFDEISGVAKRHLETTCPECGATVKYPKGSYRPLTCGRKECMFAHAHPEIKNARRPFGGRQ